MDPLLDEVPPEKGLGGGSWRGKLRGGISRISLVSGLMQRMTAAGRADIV